MPEPEVKSDAGPFSILYARECEIYQCGPFADRQEVMAWANENRFTGNESQEEYEFDLEDDYVYLMGPDHSLVELNNEDFDDEPNDDDDDDS